MDPSWRLFLTTFGAIFLAELGDKTQLATMAFSSDAGSTNARWMVFAGSAAALVTTSALGVVFGGATARIIQPVWLNRAAGALFVGLGAWMLWRGAD